MEKILMCWIGLTDLRAPTDADRVGLGPIAQAVEARGYDDVVLISDHKDSAISAYIEWLKSSFSAQISLHCEKLSGPTNFGEIYEAAIRVIETTLKRHEKDVSLTFHLSPGTPAMASVWIILAKTRFPAELIESSPQKGVQTASVPFDISADFIPDLLHRPDERLKRLSSGSPPESPEFSDIIHRSAVMKRVIAKARRIAPRSIPVVIEGETGTGKELLARAIHRSSTRRKKPFIAVNCGAIPNELVESELFGHEKGAFTGADRLRKGYFEAAHTGSLFLDEISEVPLSVQVKLLRILQEGEVVHVGATKPIKINVRIIAATNRELTTEISNGHFRSDLFYRLAVGVLRLPPLRDRTGDLSLLIDYLLDEVNNESIEEPGHTHKKLYASARNLLLLHAWPGNVRELKNTILRASVWSEGETITSDEIKEALLPIRTPSGSDILGRPLDTELKLPELINTVARHYLGRALEETRGNKSQAANLVGLPSYQTFTNWLKKYGVEQ